MKSPETKIYIFLQFIQVTKTLLIQYGSHIGYLLCRGAVIQITGVRNGSRMASVTEYSDPLTILALALISQEKWAPSNKFYVIFGLNVNSNAIFFSCF